MLVFDAVLTVTTWLPFNLYLAISAGFGYSFLQMYTIRQVLTMEAILRGIMLTNLFSTPVVYFASNSNFRVSDLT